MLWRVPCPANVAVGLVWMFSSKVKHSTQVLGLCLTFQGWKRVQYRVWSILPCKLTDWRGARETSLAGTCLPTQSALVGACLPTQSEQTCALRQRDFVGESKPHLWDTWEKDVSTLLHVGRGAYLLVHVGRKWIYSGACRKGSCSFHYTWKWDTPLTSGIVWRARQCIWHTHWPIFVVNNTEHGSEPLRLMWKVSSDSCKLLSSCHACSPCSSRFHANVLVSALA